MQKIAHLIKIFALLCATAFIANGCWYSFADKPFPEIATIAVLPLANTTNEYDVESRATELLTRKLSSSSSYRLVRKEIADASLSGDVVFYSRAINTYDEAENPKDYIVRVRAKLTFTRTSDEKTLWSEYFEGYATFLPDGDESYAKDEAIKMLVERIYDKLKTG